MLTLQVEGVDQEKNNQSEEKLQQAQICITSYQQQSRAAHHKKVKVLKFQVGDCPEAHDSDQAEKDQRKLGPNWEGPYIIVAQGGKG